MTQATKLTTAEFDNLLKTGVLEDGGPEYLWDGEICTKMVEYPEHVNAVSNLGDQLEDRLGRVAWTVNEDKPVELSDGYKPEPDISVMVGPRRNYRGRAPQAKDIVLLAEVSNSSYYQDSKKFLSRYALEGIPQYWIVNIDERRVEVYQEPEADHYRIQQFYTLGEAVPLVLMGNAYRGIPVLDILCDSLPEEPS